MAAPVPLPLTPPTPECGVVEMVGTAEAFQQMSADIAGLA
jgi:hypothetical protein